MFDAIRFSISADNRAGAAFRSVRAGLGDVSGALATVQQRAARAGADLRGLGRGMSRRVTLPIAGALAGVIHSAAAFEASMNRVAALSGATGDSFDALRDQAKDLGATTKFSASQAADAMGFLSMAGFNATEILGAMPATLQLAAASGEDLATSADIVSNILSGFGKEVGDLAAVNDVLVAALSSSNTDLIQLGDALKYVGPVAASAGLDFNEVTAAIGMLGNAGIQGEMGGTALRGMITRLINPTKEAAGVLEDLGVSVFNSEGRMRSLSEIMAQLEPHAENTGALMELFGQRAGPAMAALLSAGTEELISFTAELDRSGGTAAQIADIQMQGFTGQLTQLKSAAEGLAIAIADSGLLEWVTSFTLKATDFVRALSESNPALLRMGVVAAGLAAALGPVLIVAGSLVTVLGAVLSPIGLAVAAIAGLATGAYLLIANFEEVSAFLSTFWAGIGESFAAGRDTLLEAVRGVGSAIKGVLVGWATDWLNTGRDMIRGLIEGITSMIPEMNGTVGSVGRRATRQLRAVTETRSPSRVFARIGSDWMAGLLQGVRGGGAAVVGAVEDVGEEATRAGARANAARGAFQGMFKSILTGSQTASGALAGLLEQSSSKLIDTGLSSLFGSFGGGTGGLWDTVGSWFGFAKGGAFSGGNVVPFAAGGVVSSPSVFPMSGGRTGLMGEAGPEAIMPLTRIGGALGVRADLGGGGQSAPAAQAIHLTIDEGLMFAARVRVEAEGVAVRVNEQFAEASDLAFEGRVNQVAAAGDRRVR